jgi:hypothetical protein
VLLPPQIVRYVENGEGRISADRSGSGYLLTWTEGTGNAAKGWMTSVDSLGTPAFPQPIGDGPSSGATFFQSAQGLALVSSDTIFDAPYHGASRLRIRYLDSSSPTPQAPRITSFAALDSSTAEIRWTPTVSSSEYRLEYSINGAPYKEASIVFSADEQSKVLSGLLTGTDYRMRMRAQGVGGVSVYSNEVTLRLNERKRATRH